MSLKNLLVERIAGPARSQLKRGYSQAISAVETMYPQAQKYLADSLKSIETGMGSYLQMGQGALQSLSALQADPISITKTPYYQFQSSEGLRLLQQQKAAQGKYFSGETLKAIEQYGQGLASTSYGQEFARQQSLAQLGMGAQEYVGQAQQTIGGAQSALAMGKAEDIASMFASKGRDIAKVEFSAPGESIRDDQGITNIVKSWMGMFGAGGGGGG